MDSDTIKSAVTEMEQAAQAGVGPDPPQTIVRDGEREADRPAPAVETQQVEHDAVFPKLRPAHMERDGFGRRDRRRQPAAGAGVGREKHGGVLGGRYLQRIHSLLVLEEAREVAVMSAELPSRCVSVRKRP